MITAFVVIFLTYGAYCIATHEEEYDLLYGADMAKPTNGTVSAIREASVWMNLDE